MNRITDEVQRLERATTTSALGSQPLDPETAAWHETWTAFGELLDGATAERSCPEVDFEAICPPTLAVSRKNVRLHWIIAIASMFLLIVVSLPVWRLLTRSRPMLVAHRPVVMPQPTITGSRSATAAIVSPDSQTRAHAPDIETDSALAWDDGLEQSLNQAWVCACELQEGKPAIDVLRDNMTNDITSLQQEIASDSAL